MSYSENRRQISNIAQAIKDLSTCMPDNNTDERAKSNAQNLVTLSLQLRDLIDKVAISTGAKPGRKTTYRPESGVTITEILVQVLLNNTYTLAELMQMMEELGHEYSETTVYSALMQMQYMNGYTMNVEGRGSNATYNVISN